MQEQVGASPSNLVWVLWAHEKRAMRMMLHSGKPWFRYCSVKCIVWIWFLCESNKTFLKSSQGGGHLQQEVLLKVVYSESRVNRMCHSNHYFAFPLVIVQLLVVWGKCQTLSEELFQFCSRMESCTMSPVRSGKTWYGKSAALVIMCWISVLIVCWEKR